MTFFLILLAAIGCGLIGGVFFAFSTFVMHALRNRPPAEGMAAMREINVAVINPGFLGAFLGTAIVCVVAGVQSVTRWENPQSILLIMGAALYIVGTFGVTMLFNVPLNNTLANMSADDANAANTWSDYARRWTVWNHIRTIAAIAAMACFIFSLRRA